MSFIDDVKNNGVAKTEKKVAEQSAGNGRSTIFGELVDMVYFNEENGFGIYSLMTDAGAFVSVKGNLSGALVGEKISATVVVEKHPEYGDSFKVVGDLSVYRPDNADAIVRFLSSGFAKGIGEGAAEAFVEAFGVSSLDALDRITEPFADRVREMLDNHESIEESDAISRFAPGSIERDKAIEEWGIAKVREFFTSKMRTKKDRKFFGTLLDVPGIGVRKASWLLAGWIFNKSAHELGIFLHGLGIGESTRREIIRAYGRGNAMQRVMENPYDLMFDVPGVRFTQADSIGKKLEIPERDKRRIGAGLGAVLIAESQSGHSCMPVDDIIEKTLKLLSFDDDMRVETESALDTMTERKKIVRCEVDGSPDVIYPTALFGAETKIVGGIMRLLSRGKTLDNSLFMEAVSNTERLLGIRFDDSQIDALRTVISNPVSVLSGGPGTGKTTVLRALCEYFSLAGEEFRLLSPTGKAARRMAESTGYPASTIHSAIKLNPETGYFKETLDTNAVVVDETSMLDLVVAGSLLTASLKATRFVFIGDCDQLPSIGAGNVLSDLVSCGIVPTAMLDTIHRQRDGGIIRNAASVRKMMHGWRPEGNLSSALAPSIYSGGFSFDGSFFMSATKSDNGESIERTLSVVFSDKSFMKQLASNGLTLDDVKILTPVRKGSAGMYSLNVLLQKLMNPHGISGFKTYLPEGEWTWRIGDRVMCIKNDRRRELCNGEQGVVESVDERRRSIGVVFPDVSNAPVVFRGEDVGLLYPSYAMTIHKSQGSEYPCVFIALPPRGAPILSKRLLYTGMTRAKKMCALVYDQKALEYTLSKDDESVRRGNLAKRIANPESVREKTCEANEPEEESSQIDRV